jgi:putative peptide zinc metalloprotease protein
MEVAAMTVMEEALFSPYWYRVKALKPRLYQRVRLSQQKYRGQLWYILHDPSSGQYHRIDESTYQLLKLLDGQLCVDDIWHRLNHMQGDDAPSQDDIIRLMAQLHAADILKMDITPDVEELLYRRERYQQGWLQQLKNPLSIRIPLFDPSHWLDTLQPLAGLMFSRMGYGVWVVTIVVAMLLAAMNWPDLVGSSWQQVLEPYNLLLLWLTYPVVKFLHELGHGMAASRDGGEVHEMGLMLLLFTPIPYVDASTSTLMTSNRRRMAVGAAGIMMELWLAAIALFVWLLVEDGVVRSLAFNVMLIGSFSTLLFNGNPLLRYDGYYVLADAIEIPNLAKRSSQYWGYLLLRHLFAVGDAKSPVVEGSERPWLFCYGLAAFVYRLFLFVWISIFLVEAYPMVGLLLAIIFVMLQIILPLAKQFNFLMTSELLGQRRGQTVMICTALLSAVVLISWMPIPSWTNAQGVVWPVEESRIRASNNGFVLKQWVSPGQMVKRGQILFQLEDDQLRSQYQLLKAKRDELQARYSAFRHEDRVTAFMIKDEIKLINVSLGQLQDKLNQLSIRARNDGRYIASMTGARDGQFLKRGEDLGFVVGQERALVRVVVPQDDIARIQQGLKDVSVLLDGVERQTFLADLKSQTPKASHKLPSKVLSVDGGGVVVTKPVDGERVEALDNVFQFTLTLPVAADELRVGTRAYVRFSHGYEPLGAQFWRRVQQLFLRHLDV